MTVSNVQIFTPQEMAKNQGTSIPAWWTEGTLMNAATTKITELETTIVDLQSRLDGVENTMTSMVNEYGPIS